MNFLDARPVITSNRAAAVEVTGIAILTKGIFLKLASSILVAVAGMATSIIVNRHYGADGYGFLVLIYTVTSFCISLSDLGSRYAMNRYLPGALKTNSKVDLAGFFSGSVLLQLAGMALFALAVLGFSEEIAVYFFKRPGLAPFLRIGALYIASLSALNFVFQWFQAAERWLLESLLSALFPVLYLAGVLLLAILPGGPLEMVLYANILAGGATVALGALLMPAPLKSALFRGLSLAHLFRYIKRAAYFGMPMALSGLIFYLLMWTDKALLGAYRSNKEVAFYYIAFAMIEYFMMFFKVLYTVLMPYFAGASAVDEAEIKRKFGQVFRWFLQLTLFSSIFIFFVIEPLILRLYGPDYSPAVFAARLLLVVFCLRAAGQPFGMFLVNVFGRSKLALLISLAIVAANVAANLALIPSYGIAGAAIASVAAYCVYWVAYTLFVNDFRGLIPFEALGKALLTLLVASLAYFLLRLLGLSSNLLFAFLIPAVYALALKALNEINKGDVELGRQIYMVLRNGLLRA